MLTLVITFVLQDYTAKKKTELFLYFSSSFLFLLHEAEKSTTLPYVDTPRLDCKAFLALNKETSAATIYFKLLFVSHDFKKAANIYTRAGCTNVMLLTTESEEIKDYTLNNHKFNL